MPAIKEIKGDKKFKFSWDQASPHDPIEFDFKGKPQNLKSKFGEILEGDDDISQPSPTNDGPNIGEPNNFKTYQFKRVES